MALSTPRNEETREDQRLYLDGRLREISCLDCLATLRVKKNSEHHTAVQWSTEALSHCQVFATMGRSEGGRRVYETCPRLMASIDRAVAEGELEVGAVDGY